MAVTLQSHQGLLPVVSLRSGEGQTTVTPRSGFNLYLTAVNQFLLGYLWTVLYLLGADLGVVKRATLPIQNCD